MTVRSRFIPAGAGNTQMLQSIQMQHPVHPRRRGEHVSAGPAAVGGSGSSPQARGTQPVHATHQVSNRFIPAGAGNTSLVVRRRVPTPVHPRRRGEHVWQAGGARMTDGSSPQARGTRALTGPFSCCPRFIPAGAGNTSRISGLRRMDAVHPRRRGEHSRSPMDADSASGSSPQARGTHGV